MFRTWIALKYMLLRNINYPKIENTKEANKIYQRNNKKCSK